jgi:hypothetical protein
MQPAEQVGIVVASVGGCVVCWGCKKYLLRAQELQARRGS